MKLVQAGRSAHEVARELDLTETALREWVKRAAIDAGKGPPGALTTLECEELTKLRRERASSNGARHFKSCGHVLRQGERVKFDFIAAKDVAFPVATMCRMLGVSSSGYYACKVRRPSKRVAEDTRIAAEITAAHEASRNIYGRPRVHRELKAKGIKTGKKRVERLMVENELRGRCKRRFVRTTDSKHDDPIAPNLLERAFETKAPNEAWVGDVTYIATIAAQRVSSRR